MPIAPPHRNQTADSSTSMRGAIIPIGRNAKFYAKSDRIFSLRSDYASKTSRTVTCDSGKVGEMMRSPPR